MADKPFFPGFEGDDQPAKPAAPAPPPAAKKPAFDAFADAPPAPAAPAAAPAPGTAKPPPAPPSPPPQPEDAELKPGSRKDLWKCQHCGVGNKPERNTCRSCGKGRDEAVVVPWQKNPAILAGAAIGLVVLVVLLFLVMRTDMSLHEAGPAGIDKRPRIAGSGSEDVQLNADLSLLETKRIAVSGRVVALRSGPRNTSWIALALGPAAKDDAAFKDLTATVSTGPGGYDFSEGVVLLCAFPGGKTEVAVGQYLSLSGDTGNVSQEGRNWKDLGTATAVKVDKFGTK